MKVEPRSVNDVNQYCVFNDYPVSIKSQIPSFIDRELDPSFSIMVTGMRGYRKQQNYMEDKPSVRKLYPEISAEAYEAYEKSYQSVESMYQKDAKAYLAACSDGTGQFRLAEATLPEQKIKIPVFVLGNVGQILQAFTQLMPMLAKRGTLIHLESRHYLPLKQANKFSARTTIDRITAHNGKLGFNWIPSQGSYQSVALRQDSNNWTRNQYKNSAYAGFLAEAATYYQQAQPALSKHYRLMSGRFKIDPPIVMQQQMQYKPESFDPTSLQVKGQTLQDAVEQVKAAGLFDNKVDVSSVENLIKEMSNRYDRGIDNIMVNCQGKYIKSLVDPFAIQSGIRIPSMNPVDTYTHTQFESFSLTPGAMGKNGKIVLVFNPTAIRPRPLLVIDDTEGTFSPLNTPAPVIKQIVQSAGSIYQDNANKTMAIWGTGPQADGFIMSERLSAPVGSIFNQIDQRYAGKIRLVSAGIRVFKTSQAISEQGVMRVAYKPRGGQPQTSLDRMLETGPNSRYSIKVFPAQATTLNTRSGFLAQSVYRPHVIEDVEKFYSTTQDFCSDEYLTVPLYNSDYPQLDEIEPDGPDVRNARNRFIGPMTFFGKRQVDPTWDFLNNPAETFQQLDWRGAAGTQYAFSAYDFGRQHASVITLEGLEGVSLDVEIVRHFELIPGEESPLELKPCQLGLEFASPIDLIRRFKVDHLEPNPFNGLPNIVGKSVWDLEPIYNAQSDVLKLLPRWSSEPDDVKVKGLMWDGIKWLLKHIAPHAVKWITDKLTNAGPIRGLEESKNNDSDADCDTLFEYSFETAGNDARFADIEKNPGPVNQLSLILCVTSQTESDGLELETE